MVVVAVDMVVVSKETVTVVAEVMVEATVVGTKGTKPTPTPWQRASNVVNNSYILETCIINIALLAMLIMNFQIHKHLFNCMGRVQYPARTGTVNRTRSLEDLKK